MGKVRHVADIRADDMVAEGQDFVQLQSGTNKYASQKGMSMGSVRHVADIRADDLSREGMDYVQLQSGSSSGQMLKLALFAQFGPQFGLRYICDLVVFSFIDNKHIEFCGQIYVHLCLPIDQECMKFSGWNEN